MMILLDPELEPESPHGRRPVHGDPDAAPAAKVNAAKRTVAPAVAAPQKELRLPSARTLARFLAAAQKAVRLKGQVTVLLTTDAAIRGLNRKFRGKNKATDVLSFPAEGLGSEGIAGDLAISVTTALGQAAEQRHSLSTEIKVLILHGLLHLAGYDHEADDGKMARRERVLRGRLGLPQGLIERAGAAKQGEKKFPKKHPSGAKAQVRIAPFTARLKSCPFKTSDNGDCGELRPRVSKAEPRAFKAESCPFKAEPRTFKAESWPFKAEPRTFKAESWPFKAESCPFKAEPRTFKAESWPFKTEPRVSKASKPRAKAKRP